jgi:hypothetical protein
MQPNRSKEVKAKFNHVRRVLAGYFQSNRGLSRTVRVAIKNPLFIAAAQIAATVGPTDQQHLCCPLVFFGEQKALKSAVRHRAEIPVPDNNYPTLITFK